MSRHTLSLVAVLTACAHPQVAPTPAPVAAPSAPPPALAAVAPTPDPTPAPPPLDPIVLLPTDADAAISYRGKDLSNTWLWLLVRAAVETRAPGFTFSFGSQCGIVPMLAIDQLDVDLHGLGASADPSFTAVFQVVSL